MVSRGMGKSKYFIPDRPFDTLVLLDVVHGVEVHIICNHMGGRLPTGVDIWFARSRSRARAGWRVGWTLALR